ncbi:hypothetical protein NMY22_g12284 [Coprinellus aureogranulatus]|nr:hypothetical protein NMY22_g12284 [Coprinellus aureogranulatus]
MGHLSELWRSRTYDRVNQKVKERVRDARPATVSLGVALLNVNVPPPTILPRLLSSFSSMPPSRTNVNPSTPTKLTNRPSLPLDFLIRGFASLDYDLRERLMKNHLNWRRRRTNVKTASVTITRAPDGDPTSVVLLTRDELFRWIEVVAYYYSHRTPRSRPASTLESLDPNTQFWVLWSPFRSLTFLEITLTGPVHGQDLTTIEVGNLGRHLAWLPLRRLTLRTRLIDQLCNGLIRWPRLPHPTEMVVEFTMKCPPNEWKRPFFPHTFHAFPALASLSLQVVHAGGNFTPLAAPDFLFDRHSKGFPHIPRRHRETTPATVERVGRNVSQVCSKLTRMEWRERRYVGNGWVTSEVVYERDTLTNSWTQVI